MTSKFNPYEHLKISLNDDGTLSRFNKMPQMEPNPNPGLGEAVASKDVTINAKTNVWARIFCPTKLPANDGCVARLPIVTFFHHGGWIGGSASDLIVNERCGQTARELPCIIISVTYRLAPEHKLPAPYEDAMDALFWVRQQIIDPNGEKWLKEFGDFSRFYLAGRGNGANMAYNARLMAFDVDLEPLIISGIILNQPMFSGNRRTKSELKYACDEICPLPVWDLLWELALPEGANKDHKYCNPLKDPTIISKVRKIGKCLVIGYSTDPMIDRQQEFVTMLVNGGANVEAHFDVGFHGIDLVDTKRASYSLYLTKKFVT